MKRLEAIVISFREEYHEELFVGLDEVLEANRRSLRRLAIPAVALDLVPVWLIRSASAQMDMNFMLIVTSVHSNLTHLDMDLHLGEEKLQLGILLRHAESLQSFTMLNVRQVSIFHALGELPYSLPSLHEFKIMSNPYHLHETKDDDDTVAKIARFVRGRQRLRRLDISLTALTWEAPTTRVLIEAIKELRSLTVLGLDISGDYNQSYFQSLAQSIPESLVALRLSITGEHSSLQADLFLPMVGCIFFHMSPFSNVQLSWKELPSCPR
jgi:hypothetical protein